MNYENIIMKLEKMGVIFTEGLQKQEFVDIERYYKITFPPDLNAFLSTALPISNEFINWRDCSEGNINRIKDRLGWPLEGMIFDIEHNSFWYSKWGAKPNDLSKSIEMCKEEFNKVPKLIPVCSHRYIPSEPNEVGNPIFSVYQTDIIYYGENLLTYLEVEFHLKNYEEIDLDSIKKIRFWSDFVG
ncbi:MAG: hypothetical protein WAX04_09240 [Oscillospiraceae bacterium]